MFKWFWTLKAICISLCANVCFLCEKINKLDTERETERDRARESERMWEIRGSEHVPWLGRGRHSPCIRPGCWRRTWTWRLDLELSWRSPADTGSRARSRALRNTNANTNALLHTVPYKHYCTELEEWSVFLLSPKLVSTRSTSILMILMKLRS